MAQTRIIKLKCKINTPILLITLLFLTSSLKAQPAGLDSLQNLLEIHSDRDSARVDILIEIAQLFANTDKDLFFKYLNEATEISYEINYILGQAESHRLSAGFYLRRASYDSALIHIDRSSVLYDSIGNKKGKAYSDRAYSIYYMLTDNYSKAIDFCFLAINQFEAMGDKENLSKTLNNLAGIFVILEEYDKGLEYYNRASGIENELGNKFITASILANIADIHIARGQFESSTKKLKEALDIAQEMEHPPLISYVLASLGKSLFMQGDNNNSIIYYEKSLAMSNKYGFNDIKSDNLTGLAEVYLDEQEFNQAKYYGTQALELIRQLRSLARLQRIYEIMSELNYATGNFKQAYEFHRDFKVASDSVFSEKNIRELTYLEDQYQFEKEKEAIATEQSRKDAVQQAEIRLQTQLRNIFIAGSLVMLVFALITFRSLKLKRKANKLLTMQKAEIQKQSKELEVTNHKLKDSNATKDKFFSIVSHDLKGPFSAIIGLSQMLLMQHKKYDQQQREEMIKLMVDSSINANNFLENLLKWSMSQTGRLSFKPAPLTTESVISSTFSLVGSTAKNKKIELINTSNEDLDIHADKDQIETILRNLISNSIKFTNENGTITVNANQNEQETIFTIDDNGIGMDEGKIEKLFNITEKTHTVGTNNETGTGLGLILCKEFVEMHHGKIWVESEVGKGSTFYFSIPKV